MSSTWLIWYLILIVSVITSFTTGILEKKQHQTNASLERLNDLTCFNCNSLFDKNCENVSTSSNATSKLYTKCKGDKRTCMVKKYSYTTSSENSTTKVKMWSLERNCTNKCQEGCIIIGERTKLYACTTCCTTNYCNVGNNAVSFSFLSCVMFVSINVLLILL